MQVIQQKLATGPAQLTGLLHSLDQNTAQTALPAIIIVPGGGYHQIPVGQAETLALAFAGKGYQAFYLEYTLISDQQPLGLAPVLDLGRVIQLIHQNATAWHIDTNQITPVGFSAGGHIVALYNDYWHTLLPQRMHVPTSELTIANIILSYPVINPTYGYPTEAATLAKWTTQPNEMAADDQINVYNRPTFIWATADDPLVPATNALAYATGLAKQQLPYELHLFDHGPHGLALANLQTAWKPDANLPHAAHWFELALEWLHQQAKQS